MNVNGFLRRLTNLDTIDHLVEIGLAQVALIHEQRDEMVARELEHARNLRDLVIQFRQQIEMPDDELVPRLDAAIVDLADSVARLEEHVS